MGGGPGAGAPAPSARPRRSALFVAVPTVLVVAAIGVGFPLRSIASAEHFRLTALSARASGPTIDVRGRAEGPIGASTPFQAWFTLTLPGSDTQVYRSEAVTGIAREAGTPLHLREDPAVLPGRYDLHLWLHIRKRTGFVHADVRSATVDLSGARPEGVRAQPAGPTTVTGTVDVRDGFPTQVLGAAVVTTRATTARSVQVDVGLQPVVAAGRPPAPVQWLQTESVELTGPGRFPVLIDAAAVLPAGSYRTAFQVRRPGRVDDLVVLPAVVELDGPPAALRRSTPPAGDLVIASVDAPARLTDGQQETVSADVVNLSTEPRTAQVSTSIAPIGEREPWTDKRAACTSPEVLLGGREQRRVELSCIAASPPGTAEVSVWVHQVAGGRSTHSDGVRVARRTRITASGNVRHRLARSPGAPLLSVVGGPRRAIDGEPLDGQAVVTNLSERVLEADVWWVLSDGPGARPADEGRHRRIQLQPGEVRGLTVTGDLDVRPGRYDLSIVVHTREPGQRRWVHGDQAWAGSPVTVRSAS